MQQRMAFLATAVAVLWPVSVPAQPACAPAPGTRFVQVAEMGAWERSRIASLSAVGPARLYLGGCGMDCVEGITQPRPAYDAAIKASDAALTLVLSADGAERGTLTFAWPDSHTWFGADTDLGDDLAEGFYTELRMAATVTGSGDFTHDGPARAELVLSGFGDMCITRRSFSGWSLTVTDEGAHYRLFGGLKP